MEEEKHVYFAKVDEPLQNADFSLVSLQHTNLIEERVMGESLVDYWPSSFLSSIAYGIQSQSILNWAS